MSLAESFASLDAAVRQASARMARLYAVDLHVHSAESHDYAGPPFPADVAGNLEAEALWFAGELRNAAPHLGVVAITDHLKCRLACAMAEAKLGEGAPLIIPGLELALTPSELTADYVHCLVLFPPGSSAMTVYGLVSALEGSPKYEDANGTEKLPCQMRALLAEVEKRGAVCIAAHVNSSHGVREWARKSSLTAAVLRRAIRELGADGVPGVPERLSELEQELRAHENDLQNAYLQFVDTCDIHAVQVRSSEDVPHYRGEHCREAAVRPIACVAASDAHQPADAGALPTCTYLRMASQTFDGLRNALADPVTRIRFDEPHRDRTVLKGIRFVPDGDADHGFFRGDTIAFSENLTCMIGPRSSGKSAVVEAIRYALGKGLPADRSLQEDAVGRLRATCRNTTVQVLVSPAGQQDLTVCRRLDEDPAVYTSEGAAVTASIPISVYGWSEIEHLARDWGAQRKLIDGGGIERGLVQRLEDARSSLAANRADIVQATRALRTYNDQLVEMDDVKRRLDRLNSPQLRKAFAASDRAATTSTVARHLLAAVKAPVSGLLDAETGKPTDVARLLQNSVSSLIEGPEGRSSDIDGILKETDLQAALTAAVSALDQAGGAIRALLDAAEQVHATAGQRHSDATHRAEDEALRVFAEDIKAGRETPESVAERVRKRESIQREYDELLRLKTKRDGESERQRKLMDRRRVTLLPAFLEAQRAISQTRQGCAAQIEARLGEHAERAPVSVKVVASGDRASIRDALYNAEEGRGLLTGSNVYAFIERGVADALARELLPGDLVEAVMTGDAEERIAAALKETGPASATDDARRIVTHLGALQADGSLDPDRLDTLLGLEEIELEDRPTIMLDGVPIEDLSPGGRCTALMPIVVTEGDWPLVIDQPEDNLDNAMVFAVLVDVLRGLKDVRQVIVATHNPNIPVSGDAEQVVVLEAPSGTHGQVRDQAAIDTPEIITHVKQIMEGGDEAFRTRARKYGYRLQKLP